MKEFDKLFVPLKKTIRKKLLKIFEQRDCIYDRDIKVDQPLSDHFTIYCYPKVLLQIVDSVLNQKINLFHFQFNSITNPTFSTQEVDYFSNEIKQKYRLLQIDTPLYADKIPKPFVLPEDFKNLPGKLIYVSFGSLFSNYVDKIQQLVDILEQLPHKYVVSKGFYGDQLRFPSNKFIGENYVDQLAVLQVADLMIAHGTV